jgi:NitT/TauT family transport system permease protein
MLEREEPPESWFYDLMTGSWILTRFTNRVWEPAHEWLDIFLRRRAKRRGLPAEQLGREGRGFPVLGLALGLAVLFLYGGWQAASLLWKLPAASWLDLAKGLGATLLRVNVSLFLALLWTVPVGVLIGTNRRLATFLQPLVQVVAAIPATALFPILLLALLTVPGGLNIAAISLMLMGTQWYLLFNVIAGAAAIPQDLINTTALLRLSLFDRWKTLILPALFPYIITGAITASGGAWNASIVAEYVEFGGQTHSVVGIGALIAKATDHSDYPLLLAATLLLVLTVVLINRTFWLKLYRISEERYRLE